MGEVDRSTTTEPVEPVEPVDPAEAAGALAGGAEAAAQVTDRLAATRRIWSDWDPRGASLVWTVAALFVAGCGLMLLRRPTAVSDPTMWLEDAAIFMGGALDRGIASIGVSYAGYLHVLPRSVAYVATFLPFRFTPTLYALAAACISCACVLPVLSRRLAWLMPSLAMRVLTFALLICLPRVTEIHATLTNVIWWVGIALLLVLLSDDPERPITRVIEVGAVVLLVLTGLNGVILAPFIVLRWWRTRSRYTLLLGAVWWCAAALQLWELLRADRTVGSDLPAPGHLVWWGVQRTLGPFFVTTQYVDEKSHMLLGMPPAATIAVGVLSVALIVVVVLGQRPSTSILLFGAFGVCLGSAFYSLGSHAVSLPERYTAVPAAAMVIGLVSARPDLRRVQAQWIPAKGLQYVRTLLLVWIVVLIPVNFPVPPRSHLDWSGVAACLEANVDPCDIPVQPIPGPPMPPFDVQLPPRS